MAEEQVKDFEVMEAKLQSRRQSMASRLDSRAELQSDNDSASVLFMRNDSAQGDPESFQRIEEQDEESKGSSSRPASKFAVSVQETSQQKNLAVPMSATRQSPSPK